MVLLISRWELKEFSSSVNNPTRFKFRGLEGHQNPARKKIFAILSLTQNMIQKLPKKRTRNAVFFIQSHQFLHRCHHQTLVELAELQTVASHHDATFPDDLQCLSQPPI